jgi:hypothetical protein
MMGRGSDTKRPDSDSVSFASTKGSSSDSRSHSEPQEGQVLVGAASLSYFRTTSRHGPHRSASDHGVKDTVRTAPSISRLRDLVDYPNEYTAETSKHTAGPDTVWKKQTITRTASLRANAHREHLPLPPGHYQSREITLAGSSRKSRSQPIYCRPEDTTGLCADPVAHPSRTNSHIDQAGKLDEADKEEETDEVDEEEEGILQMKREIRRMKAEDVSSTSRTLRIAEGALEVGAETLRTLQEQGDRLQSAKDNLERTEIETRESKRKLEELKQVNHMLNFHAFTAKGRGREAVNERITEKQRMREEKDALRHENWHRGLQESRDRISTNVLLGDSAMPREIAQRKKYQFEADSDDDEQEELIEAHLRGIQEATRKLNVVASAQGSEIERQNVMIDGMKRTVDRVDDKLTANQARLDGFR